MFHSSEPLDNPRHETFALAVANGSKLHEAYELAGFTGKSRRLSWELRHRPEVDARVKWMLDQRVKAQTRSFVRRQKSKGDLLDRAIRELEAIAFQDIREVADWRREPVLNADGEVIGTESSLVIRDAADLSSSASKAIKSVFLKGGALRVDLHDKRAALEAIVKLLAGQSAQPAGNVNVTQINVGQMGALDMAKRVHFLLAAARHAQAAAPAAPVIEAAPAGPVFEGRAVGNSEETDVPIDY